MELVAESTMALQLRRMTVVFALLSALLPLALLLPDGPTADSEPVPRPGEVVSATD